MDSYLPACDPEQLWDDDDDNDTEDGSPNGEKHHWDAPPTKTDLVDELDRITLEVRSHDDDGRLVAESSGFAAGDRVIALPIHLREDMQIGDPVKFETSDGVEHDAKIIAGVLGQPDVALAQTEDDLSEFVPHLADQEARAGEHVTALDKVGDTFLVKGGIVSGPDPTAAGDTMVSQLNSGPGMSMGALVNDRLEMSGAALAANLDKDATITLGCQSLSEICAAAEHHELRTKELITGQYSKDFVPIASQYDVWKAQREAEDAKHAAERRDHELEEARQAKSRAERS